MTVLSKNRSISKYQFYMNAVYLRKSIVFFCLRDFGVKPKVRSPTYFFDNTWSEEDKDTLIKLFHDHDYKKIEGTYPYWLIEMYRNRLISLANTLVENIIAAYSIFSFTIEEAYLRRNMQDLAIAACYNIKATFELMVDTITLNNQTMLEFVKKIDEEIALLKGWRKQNNKLIAKMQTQFSEYAKLNYIKMYDVTHMPKENPMEDKAKLEHALREADVQMMQLAETKTIDNFNK